MANLPEIMLPLFCLFFFIVLNSFSYFLKSRRSSRRLLPPSPFKLPIIGHLHLLGKLPHQSLQNLALKHGSLMFLKFGIRDVVVASSAEAAREVLKVQDHVFPSRPEMNSVKNFGYGGAGLIWTEHGEHWRNMRKLCTTELLTAKRVEMLQPVRKSEVSHLLSELLHHANLGLPVNLTTKLSDITFNVMTRMVMNKSFSARAASRQEKEETVFFKNMVVEAFKVADFSTSDFIPALKWFDRKLKKGKAIKEHLDSYLHKQLVEHRMKRLDRHGSSSKPDLIDTMLALGDSLSDTSIKSLSLDMIAAGTDTTAVTMEWALAELMKNPSAMAKAQQELLQVVGKHRCLEEQDLPKLTYLNAMFKETLRLHPPGPLMAPHSSTQQCKLGEYTIPARTIALINVYAIARDPKFWERPLEFDPERFLNENSPDVRGQSFQYLPFGSGRRSCPGIVLGLTVGQFALGSLLHAFDWNLPNGMKVEDLDMSEAPGLSIPRASHLELVPTARLNPEAYSFPA